MIFSDSKLRRTLVLLWFFSSLTVATVAQASGGQRFILECPSPYDGVVAAVEALGGKVTYRYENIGAIAGIVPSGKRSELLALQGVTAVYKDSMIGSPQPTEIVDIDGSEIQGVINGGELRDALGEAPAGFLHNLDNTGARTLHDAGITGGGVIVAVIDSGTANNPAVVPSIAGKVIGGENFVPGPEPSATSTQNDPHGTWVGTTIAADIGFLFGNAGVIVQSLLAHAPASVILDFPFPGVSVVPMVGTAPNTQLYAIKVFSAAGGGAPESRIIAAMDRTISLRRNFNNGMPSVPVSGDGSENDPFVFDSLDIQVVNMSLGGPTLFAGRDLEDQLTQAMLDVGITLVASAGNEGHAASTGGSPGTGIGSVTSGAASIVANERFLRDLQGGLGLGFLFRPAEHHQMATFSSRGPTADGRIDPDNVASGFAVFAQSAGGGLSVVSGTSFSAPNTSGGAALLRQGHPSASAKAIGDALVNTANPNFLGDNSANIDQGHGFVDFESAFSNVNGASGNSNNDDPSDSVRKNFRNVGFRTVKFENDEFSTHIPDLVPGQVAHFFVRSRENTDRLTITLENIDPELPPSQQNALFGDDIFLKVQDAVTSDEADPFAPATLFISSDTTLTFDNPQTGIVRVAVMGDWTNAGNISTDLIIEQDRNSQDDETADGEVVQGEVDTVTVEVPAGTAEVIFELSWEENWGHYPTNDLDMIIDDPAGSLIVDGATLNSPERVVVANPSAGEWSIDIEGFTIHDDDDDDDDDDDNDDDVGESEWELRVTADGVRLDDDDDD